MNLYRISTEDINRGAIINLINKNFDGYTLRDARGYWKGNPEASLTIEILADEAEENKIFTLARSIKRLNHQESVLVDKSQPASWFI